MAQDMTTNMLAAGERIEDAALLAGRGKYFDDLAFPRNVVHAAILRSPHAHAELRKIVTVHASALKGVHAVVTGEDYARLANPLMVGVKLPIECWPIARDRVRYVGEPVAVVLAEDRYIAEDAADLIEVAYNVMPAVIDPERALSDDAPAIHPALNGNLGAERQFRYGDPELAFAASSHQVEVCVRYPRNSCTPLETYGVLAEYDPFENSYDVLANFQGPFSIHPVISRALGVPGNRLRLRTPPNSGGSFGVKQGIFPYIVLLAVCARIVERPVKWIEDRLEHLSASVSASNRTMTLRAAVENDGRITALDWDQIEDVGAYLRAPEPATIYRMHGNMCGAYDIANLAIRNRVVMTNKTPTGLNRGFGGPQIYYALERLMQRIARELDIEPLDVIRCNLISSRSFPYRTASGAVYDSGDYQHALAVALKDGEYDSLLAKREAARVQGRLYGIGLAAVIEPSVSNMGYLSTALSPKDRVKAGPKNGAQAAATISIDPQGTVIVQIDSVPQGQGHRTVAAGVVADIFGLSNSQIQVISCMDTAKDAWSIAAGNYSSRFAAASAGAVKVAAGRLRERLANIAAAQLNATSNDINFSDGCLFVRTNPEASIGFFRAASTAHWAPATLPDGIDSPLRETAFWSAPELTAPTHEDEINSSLCHALVFDFCGIEIDPDTGVVRVDKYVTTHDCGTILHEGMVEGQIRGAFAQAVGAALYEELAYAEDGAFLAGTFADYPVPTAHEIPELDILHVCTPSPLTPLGAKGVGEGNCMSTPVCIANAVADALGSRLDGLELTLPLTPAKILALLDDGEPVAPHSSKRKASAGGRGLTGQGRAFMKSSPQVIWNLLMDPNQLAVIVPGTHSVKKLSATQFNADITLGVGPIKGRYAVELDLSELDPPSSMRVSGRAIGSLGSGEGSGRITLTPTASGGAIIAYDYETRVSGKVAAVGARLLDGATKIVIGQFFSSLGRQVASNDQEKDRVIGWFRSLIRRLF